MPDALPFYVFVASPGDVTTERDLVSTCIDEHNLRQEHDGVHFKMVGWESVRGTARRPQEAINELIGESHYLITMLKGSWGSEPGSPWGYSSGTEEELFNGLLELGQPEQPMRDIWVAFLPTVAKDSKIQTLRDQMTNNHALMYETIADARDLKTKLTERLQGWAATAATKKVARHVDLLPSSGRDILRSASMRRNGEKLIELGQPEIGGQMLEEAAALGGPPEQLAYAKYLERRGDLTKARSTIQTAIDYFTTGPGVLNSTLAAQAFSADARILGRQGDKRGAIGRLQQALTLLTGDDRFSKTIRCRILDDLGLAYQAVEDLTSARETFQQALKVRLEQNETVEIGQSYVNLARVEGRARNLEPAREFTDMALAALKDVPPSALHANAEVLQAQLLLRQGNANDAIPSTERAIAINRQLGNRQGEAIALLLSAQCNRSAGNSVLAKAHAQQCLEINQEMGDKYGQDRASWLLDQLGASS